MLPLRWARDAMQDVRYGLRGLRKSPRFTIAAVLTVVLGVGANATIFSVLNPLLFKPLPYPEPDRIVNVFRTSPQSDRWPHSMANYLDHRARNTVFEHLAALTLGGCQPCRTRSARRTAVHAAHHAATSSRCSASGR